MATATTVYTPSMQAQATVLLERASRWARGTRNRDGLPIVLFVSSRTDAAGNPIYWKTRADGLGCDCPSWLYRGACSHALACQMDTQRQAQQQPSATAWRECRCGALMEPTHRYKTCNACLERGRMLAFAGED